MPLIVFGLLNLNKPAGITSRDAVNRVQRLVPRSLKVGHAGTLDPLATGVLIVTIGPATRLTTRIQQWPKTYCATFLLGRSSDTEDTEGDVVVDARAESIAQSVLEQALPRLTGTIQQRPPAYSAVKIAGQRAYRLARAGAAVELAPRAVTIHELRIVRYDYPAFALEVVCGSGTYIRSLGRDLAALVGTTAVMSQLTRTAIGPLTLDQAVEIGELNRENLEWKLLPAVAAVPELFAVRLDPSQLQRVARGMCIPFPGRTDDQLAALTPDGRLVAILGRTPNGDYHPNCNFPTAGGPALS